MNPERPLTPREELEVRVTALLMGELPPEEAQLLEAQIAADADLKTLHERLRHAVELLREASAIPEQPAPPVPVTLSEERRKRLLEHFKVVTPMPVAAKPKRDWKWVAPLGLAASLIALLGSVAIVKMGGGMERPPNVADFDTNGARFETNDEAGVRLSDRNAPSQPAENFGDTKPAGTRSFDWSGPVTPARTNGEDDVKRGGGQSAEARNHWYFWARPSNRQPADRQIADSTTTDVTAQIQDRDSGEKNVAQAFGRKLAENRQTADATWAAQPGAIRTTPTEKLAKLDAKASKAVELYMGTEAPEGPAVTPPSAAEGIPLPIQAPEPALSPMASVAVKDKESPGIIEGFAVNDALASVAGKSELRRGGRAGNGSEAPAQGQPPSLGQTPTLGTLFAKGKSDIGDKKSGPTKPAQETAKLEDLPQINETDAISPSIPTAGRVDPNKRAPGARYYAEGKRGTVKDKPAAAPVSGPNTMLGYAADPALGKDAIKDLDVAFGSKVDRSSLAAAPAQGVAPTANLGKEIGQMQTDLSKAQTELAEAKQVNETLAQRVKDGEEKAGEGDRFAKEYKFSVTRNSPAGKASAADPQSRAKKRSPESITFAAKSNSGTEQESEARTKLAAGGVGGMAAGTTPLSSEAAGFAGGRLAPGDAAHGVNNFGLVNGAEATAANDVNGAGSNYGSFQVAPPGSLAAENSGKHATRSLSIVTKPRAESLDKRRTAGAAVGGGLPATPTTPTQLALDVPALEAPPAPQAFGNNKGMGLSGSLNGDARGDVYFDDHITNQTGIDSGRKDIALQIEGKDAGLGSGIDEKAVTLDGFNTLATNGKGGKSPNYRRRGIEEKEVRFAEQQGLPGAVPKPSARPESKAKLAELTVNSKSAGRTMAKPEKPALKPTEEQLGEMESDKKTIRGPLAPDSPEPPKKETVDTLARIPARALLDAIPATAGNRSGDLATSADGTLGIPGAAKTPAPATEGATLAPQPKVHQDEAAATAEDPKAAKWLYVLRDGTMGPKSLASEANPIVGRTAFWTDDESNKLNIDTASEGVFWDTPPPKLKIDEALRSKVDDTQAAQILIKTLPALPPEGQAEAVQQVARLLPEQEYARVLPPELRAKVKEARDEEEARTPRPAPPADEPQPEIATKENAFSTFSLNVSDVAFKLAGGSLEQGKMPEPGTIRSEEFINAFDYHDPEPAPGAPLAFASERARYPFAQNRDLLRCSVKTAAAGRQAGKPLNVVLLLDNSGSMERADRVHIVKEALHVLSGQLQPQDKLSVVTFARTPRLWIDGVSGDKAGEATERVSEITPQGGTNIEAALDLGYATALKHYQPGSINRVVMLTDGAANLGDVNPDALKKKVEAHRKQGIALDCFGVGWEGYDDTLLEALSRNGDGRYGFINTPEEAATEFAGQLAGALHVAASDVKVQVEFNPRRVTSYRQIGYAKHQLKKEQFRDNTVDAAEIGAAESGNALYVVEVNPRGEGDLATVRVRFKVPGTEDYQEHEWAVPFGQNAPPLEQASPALRLAASASAFSEWLAQSPYAAEVTPDRLLGLINGVPGIYGADPRPQRLEWMIRQAKNISGK